VPTEPRERDPLADAPPADEASGIAVPRPEEKHPIANTLLALPRLVAYVVLLGPRYAAGEVDDYLESRSPNAFGKDVKKTSGWRFGATLEAEKELGLDVALRVGRSFDNGIALDGYGGIFGARGESGGLRARFGSFGPAHIEPELSFDAGTDLERAYAGTSIRGPLSTYELGRIAGSAAVSGRVDAWKITGRLTADRETTSDADSTFMESYAADLAGLDESNRAGILELAVSYDSRRPSQPWIKRGAPSTGTLVRATVGQTSGAGSRSGDFDFRSVRGDLEQVFDLFHGDRVLTLGVTVAAPATDDVPFTRLPTLGGAERMRAFARDEVRADSLVYGTANYEWPLGPSSRAYIFVEGAATPRARHSDAGAGIRVFNSSSTTARLQVAASPVGDVGVFLQLGAL